MMAVHVPIFPGPALTNQTITVTSQSQSGAGSLSAAITAADKSAFKNVLINFKMPHGAIIREDANTVLPPITRNNVTIDATSIGEVDIIGSGYRTGLSVDGSSCAIKGLTFWNFSTGIDMTGASYNLIAQDKTLNCQYGISLDSASNHNNINNCTFTNSGIDGMYIAGSNNEIGLPQSAGPYATTFVTTSSGNGIEVAGSTNYIVGTQVMNCKKDGIVLDRGATNVHLYDDIVNQSFDGHGSCIVAQVGANGNFIGGVDVGVGGINRLTFVNHATSPSVTPAPDSYSLKILSTGNTIAEDRTNGTSDNGWPLTTGPDKPPVTTVNPFLDIVGLNYTNFKDRQNAYYFYS